MTIRRPGAALACLLALPAAAAEREASLVFVGDIMVAERPGELIARGVDPFQPFAPLLASHDLRIGNLECVVATGGTALAKPYTFRADPGVLPVLKRHFDAMSLANNHSGDFGKAAFAEQLDLMRGAGLAGFGGGRNATEAHAPLSSSATACASRCSATSSSSHVRSRPMPPARAWHGAARTSR